MKRSKTIVVAIAGILVIIQFVRPARNYNGQLSEQNMMQLYHTPDTIRRIIQQSCVNCHSNKTSYPWYADVQPVGWWLEYHIRKGKKELNLDGFAGYSKRRRISKLASMKDQVRDGDMPLPSYTWMHKEARLSAVQKHLLTNWIEKTIDSLNQ